MADSSRTKKALATSLKQLLEIYPFEKISVGKICEKCNMNRKSFYYHFKDKYDLVIWIFNTEFLSIASEKKYDDEWELFSDISRYIYENKGFYKKAMLIKGQNSFSEYFRELLVEVISNRLQDVMDVACNSEFQKNFFADSFVVCFQRWIVQYDDMEAVEFLEQVRLCLKVLSDRYKQVE